MRITNTYQEAIYDLMTMSNFSLADVIHESMFYKFQSRLSDVESDHGIIAKRTKRQFTNQFGRKSDYNVYNACVSQKILTEIFNSYK